MTNTPEVNWAEGMFLRPQHLQLASRHYGSLIGGVLRGAQPFFWGFDRLEIDAEQLEGFTWQGSSCAGRQAVRPVEPLFRATDRRPHLGLA